MQKHVLVYKILPKEEVVKQTGKQFRELSDIDLIELAKNSFSFGSWQVHRSED
ncbi:MAG: hypothetical protein PHC68_18690 [Syntrophorhabdaceae bacterium]|nr:hypothetical protein [Syntrophorhabdaceae bacterium]